MANLRLGASDWRSFIYLTVVLLVLAQRGAIAHYLANDEPYDGHVYALLALNLLERHTYSVDSEPPFEPTFIRLPGYPLFLAAIYKLFGHGNDTAVRLLQALLDTLTCIFVAVLAFRWMGAVSQRKLAAGAAFALAVICPFTSIYTATILTETLTMFLIVALLLAATCAWLAETSLKRCLWWTTAGIIAGCAELVRPDSGLFIAGVGLTTVIAGLCFRDRAAGPATLQLKFSDRLLRGCGHALIFATAFAVVLAPWTVRNAIVFHRFQPIAPVYANMPDEFVPRGYFTWVRTWIDDEREIQPLLWDLDSKPISTERLPLGAFDSEAERARVAELFKRYNNAQPDAAATPQAKVSANDADDSDVPDSDQSANDAKDSADKPDADDADAENETVHVKMTPELDAAFMQIARERIARAPVRYYLLLPARRVAALWFCTHSQYYPFAGELYPLDQLDQQTHQRAWLTLFAGLTWLYTLLGAAGLFVLWRFRTTNGSRWLLLSVLLILPRMMFLSSMENPEPRYVVEFFPIICILGGIAIAGLFPRGRTPTVKEGLLLIGPL